LKDKITDILKPKEEINTIASYDGIMFEQIKELQLEIEKHKKQIENNKKENEQITKKYNDMQTKMKSLLGI
jgi:flagellar biosynthesis chaperone FliJ